MRYLIRHDTEYRYTQPATLEHTSAHLQPRAAPRQTCRQHRLEIQPPPLSMTQRLDFFGNPVSIFTIEGPHDRLLVTGHSLVDVEARPPMIDGMSQPWEPLRQALRTDVSPEGLDAYQFTFDSPLSAGSRELRPYVEQSFSPGRPIFDAARELTSRIHADFAFDPKATDVSTPVSQVFAERRGVCQDFAHLMIACLRTLGLPARYVSGYLRTEPPPGQPRLIGADASHAWVSVYCTGMGWLDLDPTNDCVVDTDHVTVAWGRDYGDVTPVKGLIVGGGQHTVEARVDIVPEGDATTVAT
ncbi:MAG: transglutaminase family protein [Planctomycetota bacterium]